MLTVAALHRILWAIELKRVKWLGCVMLLEGARTWICDSCLWDENMEVWRLFVSWECGCVSVCEMKMWMYENIHVWRLFVSWECGCVSVCEMKMWMYENIHVWRLFVSWECGCVAVREMKIWKCDPYMWAENVDLWRLFVDENMGVVVIGRGWPCNLYKYEFILKLETAARCLHTRHHGVPF